MKTIDMKEQVTKAIATEWPAFAASHPNLAAAIDQTLLVEQAAANLNDDPEYQAALAAANAAGLAADALGDLVTRLVSGWLGKLI